MKILSIASLLAVLLFSSCKDELSTNLPLAPVSLPDVTDIAEPGLNFTNNILNGIHFALSPDARYLALRSLYDVRVVETQSGREVFSTTIHDTTYPDDWQVDERVPPNKGLEFTDNGAYLLIGSQNRRMIHLSAVDVIEVNSWKTIGRIDSLYHWHPSSDGAYLIGSRLYFGQGLCSYSLWNCRLLQAAMQPLRENKGYGFINNTSRCLSAGRLSAIDSISSYDILENSFSPPISFPVNGTTANRENYHYQNNRNIMMREASTQEKIFVDASTNSIVAVLDKSFSLESIGFHQRRLIAVQETSSTQQLLPPCIYQLSPALSKQELEIPTADTRFSAFLFSADGKYVAGSYKDGEGKWKVRIWKVKI